MRDTLLAREESGTSRNAVFAASTQRVSATIPTGHHPMERAQKVKPSAVAATRAARTMTLRHALSNLEEASLPALPPF